MHHYAAESDMHEQLTRLSRSEKQAPAIFCFSEPGNSSITRYSSIIMLQA
jgi:hypothetical protein